MKILFAHHDALLTTVGGIEKVCVTLANGLHAAGHDVIVATRAEAQGLPFFPLEQGVTFRNIYTAPSQSCLLPLKKYRGDSLLKKASYRLQKISRTLRNFFTYGYNHKRVIRELAYAEKAKAWKQLAEQEKPDVIVTMSMHVLREMTCGQKYTAPIVHSVNSRPDYDYTDTAKRHSKMLQSHLKEPYRHLSAIQILFPSFERFLPEAFGGKTYVIPNVVPQIPDSEIVQHTNAKERFTITNISRLDCSCKQQDVAIRAFHQIADKYPKWDLHLWGEGEDKTALERLIRKFNLEGRVFLKGVTPHPLEELKKSDIFIFPSRYEGFPLSLTEAMSVGLPSVGFITCSGVNELIRDGENGFLVNDLEECTLRLKELIDKVEVRVKLGKQAHEEMKEYTPEHIFAMWEATLHDQLVRADDISGKKDTIMAKAQQTKAPAISVLMPVYNEEVHVQEAIESILQQTFSDFELIIIDDASTDRTPSILKEYAAKDSRIRLLHNEQNLRIAASLNKGLLAARAPLIARMDADDSSFPERLSIQWEFMQLHPEVDICATQLVISETGQIWKPPCTQEEIRARFFFGTAIYHATVLCKKRALLTVNGYDETFLTSEDYHLWARLCLDKKIIFANIEKPLYSYRFTPPTPGSHAFIQQKKFDAEIYKVVLKAIQITPTTEELKCHIAFTDDQAIVTNADLFNCLDWLKKIEAANKQTQVFDPKALHKELCRRWYSLYLRRVPYSWKHALGYFSLPFATYSLRSTLKILRRPLRGKHH